MNYRICQPVTPTRPTRPPRTTTTPTTEVRSGMNLCDPDPFPLKKNGYEFNMVICEANEVCQPLASTGELAKVGYIFFSFLKFIYSEKVTKFCEISTLLLTGTT